MRWDPLDFCLVLVCCKAVIAELSPSALTSRPWQRTRRKLMAETATSPARQEANVSADVGNPRVAGMGLTQGCDSGQLRRAACG